MTIGAVVVFAVVGAIGGAAAGRSVAEAQPSAPQPSTPVISPVPPTSAAPSPSASPSESPTVEIPASCDGLYSDAVYADLTGWARLNANADAPGGGTSPTISRGIVADTLWNLDRLQCTWFPNDDFHQVIGTTVAAISPVTLEGLSEVLQNGTFTCETHRSGSLCEMVESNAYTLTTSVYMREGIIIATGMTEVSYEGYLDDVIDALWGARR
ncbi:hypothetical protein CLV49_0384 [Labedella gwakjiensis]|uniref:PknH-like protein n=1 Tax=Labedella gwakjiensis TaxID=390269 RepID=A0A2P8GS41_9MICO|nr:hypothetical protein [Labedella gwakjiensis]PSL36786.1 hypothetical protein CLV49_0384 [Labedella gwakjiensis]RUQ84296.1 hypothetical protein ELQ93_15900 [Labedella gwakjiensis]